jgi:hypothetical protein
LSRCKMPESAGERLDSKSLYDLNKPIDIMRINILPGELGNQ